MNKLYESLVSFKKLVAENEKVHKLVADWQPNIIIESIDSSLVYTLTIRDSKIDDILTGEESSNHEIKLEADEDILTSVFLGQTNPAESVLNGQMVVYGDAKDQIRLDAITLVIWGM